MNSKHFEKINPGIGATKELSLRVSVATLVRVVFTNPESGDLTLALERKATFLADEKRVMVKAQPFGGAVRINDPIPLLKLTGGFHFDSERSRAEQDFRILIRPFAWHSVRDFCLEHFQSQDDPVLESSPVRELVEEFEDALGRSLRPDQYDLDLLWTLLENEPAPTGNIQDVGQPTVRIYRVFEARIVDHALLQAVRLNSERYSDQDLREGALEDLRKGGNGRANAFLTLPMVSLQRFYLSLPPERRNSAILFGKIYLEGNVPLLLNGITVPKFQCV
jgi:hypothetical protein